MTLHQPMPRFVKYVYGGGMRIPPKQDIVLEFIRREVKMSGVFPPVSRISQYLGWTDPGVREALQRLTIKGFLSQERIPRRGQRPSFRYQLIETGR